MSVANPPRVIAAVSDLLFSSKVTGTAKALGIEVRVVGTADALRAQAADTPALIILDLGQASLNPIGLIASLKADASLSGVPVVGFANHERVELMTQAKEAGCDQVLTKGAFSSGLPALLGSLRAAAE